MLKHVSRVRWMLALSIAWSMAFGVAKAQSLPEYGGHGIIMVKQRAPVWLQCQFEAGQHPDVPGFCARLQAEFVQQSGRVIGFETVAPEGAVVLLVTIAPRDAHRAMVTLGAGRQLDGQFVESTTQQMQLGSMDAPLQASAAAALIYPLVSMLETLR